MSERIIGVRAGLAGAGEPAWLTEPMVLPPGASRGSGSVRAAPEIAFVMSARLAGPGVTMPAAMAVVATVHGAVSTDAGFFACGPVGVPPGSVDLTLEACLVEVNGQVVDSATGAAIMGHPAQALAQAANQLGDRGLAIEPGWIVLAGGMTEAVTVPAGRPMAAHFTSLGSVFLPLSIPDRGASRGRRQPPAAAVAAGMPT